MDTQQHARQLIPDYVLGLLSPDERRHVEQHARHCAMCRDAIRRERQVAALVREAVQRSAAPPANRLRQLRPSPPHPARRYVGALARQLAPVTAVLALLMTVLLTQANGLGPLRTAFVPTTPAPTALLTATHTPTATLTAVDLSATSAPGAAVTRTEAPRPAPAAPESPQPAGSTETRAAPAATPIITLR